MSSESDPKNPAEPISALHDFLLALTDPSRQMKVDPWQWLMPPFFPLQGVFAAFVFETHTKITAKTPNTNLGDKLKAGEFITFTIFVFLNSAILESTLKAS